MMIPPRDWTRSPVLAFLLLALASCAGSDNSNEVAAAEDNAHQPDIAWHQGDVDSAFSLAEQTGRPLFLYWGAEWCPPCHYLKNKIFNRPEFVVQMDKFVPVYLDGDTKSAQILGEQLDVKGYPTVIVFNSIGQEVLRMPSTIPVNQYAEVLDTAIAGMQPIDRLLEQVLASGPSSAAPEDLNLLAFYSWGQDSKLDLTPDEQRSAFDRLWRETPDDMVVERSRFLTLLIQSRMASDREKTLTPEERAEFQPRVLAILDDASLRGSNLIWVSFGAARKIDFLAPEAGPDRQQLVAAWQLAAESLEDDSNLSIDDRLNATGTRIDLASLESEDEELTPELQQHVRERVAWALEIVSDESELQAVMNTLAYLLEDAGLSSEAEELLLAKMNDTAAPYYFMSWLATIKEDKGETEEALVWYRQAYDNARGRYSRFRWGSSYLRRLMDLAPDRAETIESDSLEVLEELLQHDDAFAGGNFSRLEGLEAAYWTWNGDGEHEESLARIRDHVRASCERYPSTGVPSQNQRCNDFLKEEKVQGDSVM